MQFFWQIQVSSLYDIFSNEEREDGLLGGKSLFAKDIPLNEAKSVLLERPQIQGTFSAEGGERIVHRPVGYFNLVTKEGSEFTFKKPTR
jgi:hypothetical protein